MKKLLLTGLTAFLAFSQQAFAGCNDKCVIRNPLSGNCAYEIRVCPLSVDTIGRWLDGATPDSIQNLYSKFDPKKALEFYSEKLGLEDVQITDDVLTCVISIAATGTFGTVCAVGVAEIGPACLADYTCTAACIAAPESFVNTVRHCSGK